jgi:uncharacterized RDD family membrane protein YckC
MTLVAKVILGTEVAFIQSHPRRRRCHFLVLRLLLCAFWWNGLLLLIDLLWTAENERRQTMRDMLAGTYVVRKPAAPSRDGKVVFVYYFLFGFVLRVPEVQGPRRA